MNHYNFKFQDQDQERLTSMLDDAIAYCKIAVEEYQRQYTESGVHPSLYKIIKTIRKERRFTYLAQNVVNNIFMQAYDLLTCKGTCINPDTLLTFRANTIICGDVIILGKNLCVTFIQNEEIEGSVTSAIVKRGTDDDFFLEVYTDHSETPNAVGFDWGITTYLTGSNNEMFDSSHFFSAQKDKWEALRTAFKAFAPYSKELNIIKHMEDEFWDDIKNQRNDWQYWFANTLCQKYNYIFLETLNLIQIYKNQNYRPLRNDYAHHQFLVKLDSVAVDYGTTVHKIAIDYPSTKLCTCGHIYEELSRDTTKWKCPVCGKTHIRDKHAARNILCRGIHELHLENKLSDTVSQLVKAGYNV